ncbi:hypothetical protein TNCV_532571 [Trichonephila clavipes]|nr:hypothetical protein TNCV_532571 [Trichonephila clavipes]
MEFLKNRKDFFKDLRLDTALNETLCDAREFPDEIDIPANFELTHPRHTFLSPLSLVYSGPACHKSGLNVLTWGEVEVRRGDFQLRCPPGRLTEV